MPNKTVRFAVSLNIPEENFAKFEALTQEMIAGTQKESGCLGYDWCLSPDRKTCRLIETYADANAVVAHVTGPVVQNLVPKLRELSSITNFEVYGEPSPEVAERLKAIGAHIYPIWRGVSR